MFILSDNHFKTIYKTLRLSITADADKYGIKYANERINGSLNTIDLFNLNSMHDYIQLLYKMNVDTWNLKYSDNLEHKLVLTTGIAKMKCLSDAELYEALTSLGYQIEESYLDESKLDESQIYNALLFLELLKGKVSGRFMRDSAAYKNAGTWEIN